MAKRGRPPKETSIFKQLEGLRKVIQNTATSSEVNRKIPSIEEFIDSEDYLGLPFRTPQPIKLFPMQRIALKAFYRGTEGNENLSLTEDEIQMCKDVGLDDEDNGDFLEKYESGNLFTEMVLVWGRRSGKDFVISVLALYEAMKLLESPNGDPHSVYGLGGGAPFNILTIANSSSQAQVLFNEIKDKILPSKYFQNKMSHEGITNDSIHLLTPLDMKRNKEMEAKGLPSTLGNVIVRSGHSNSDSLAGIGCYCLLLDEIGLYKQTPGSSGGEAIYRTLTPSTATYVRKVKQMNSDGVEIERSVYDGKIICISSPRGKEGIFYELFKNSPSVPHRITCKLPTWKVNINQTLEDLRLKFGAMADEEFMMEFGAEFSGTSGQTFFSRDVVDSCFVNNLKMKERGEAGRMYYCHLDPATSSHNYALVVVHREDFVNKDTNKADFRIVVDHTKVWTPSKNRPIISREIDDYMVKLNQSFLLAQVSFDQWNSAQSIENLRKHGIPAKLTRFTKRYKIIIYDNLYDIASSNRLRVPYDELLKNEMLYLQRRFTPTGYRVFAKKDGMVKTDDSVDALAGACYGCIQENADRLPSGRLARMNLWSAPGSFSGLRNPFSNR
jgi:hypothetical protein